MRTPAKIVLAFGIVLVALAGYGVWWFLRDDAPDAVALDSAVASLPFADDAGTGAGPSLDSVTGSWVVDTESGDFDFESATGSFVGFRIQEELARVGSTTAVGRTGTVTGSMEIDGTTVTAAEFTVDLASITTNDSRRDSKVRQALETDQFPEARFVLTEPIDLGPEPTDGSPVSVVATGELTVHGVTRSVEFALDAQLSGSTVVVVGSTEVVFADFDVSVPASAIVVSTEDHGILELQLLFTLI